MIRSSDCSLLAYGKTLYRSTVPQHCCLSGNFLGVLAFAGKQGQLEAVAQAESALAQKDWSGCMGTVIAAMADKEFALGKLTLIAGDPGLGKSQLTAYLAAVVTTYGRWPNDDGRP